MGEIRFVGRFNKEIEEAIRMKKEEEALVEELKKFDLLKLGKFPKVRNKFSPEMIPYGEWCEHSWAGNSGEMNYGQLAVIRDGELLSINFSNYKDIYSDNGNIISEYEYHWDSDLKTGDVIVGLFLESLESDYNGSEREYEEYYIFKKGYLYDAPLRKMVNLKKMYQKILE